MEKTQVKTITETQRSVLVALVVQASQIAKELTRLERAAVAITGETEWGGHTGEAIYQGSGDDFSDPIAAVNTLLKRLNITVEGDTIPKSLPEIGP